MPDRDMQQVTRELVNEIDFCDSGESGLWACRECIGRIAADRSTQCGVSGG